jgi:hypothetical protein
MALIDLENIYIPLYYEDNGIVENLIGKGNHIYEPKQIDFELEQKLLNNQEEPISKTTYYNDLQKYEISSHDFRFTSARDKFEKKLNSEILNHKCEAITDYYLKRTE